MTRKAHEREAGSLPLHVVRSIAVSMLILALAYQPAWATAADYEVATSRAAVRSTPAAPSTVLFELRQGDRVQILTRQGVWCRISSAKGQGWLESAALVPAMGREKPPPISPQGTLSFAPLGGPLVISVDTNGQIRVSLEAQILTPLGTLSGSVSTDDPPYLEVQCGQQTRYFLLHEKPFSVRFLDVEGDVDLSHDGGRAMRVVLPCHPGGATGFAPVAQRSSPALKPGPSTTPTQTAAAASAPIARFVATGDGKLLDRQLQLLWTESDNRQDINWFDAKLYCQGLRMGSYRDWRLPSRAELASIQTRRAHGDYAIYPQFLISTPLHIWSGDLARESEPTLTPEQQAELDRQRQVLRQIGFPTGRDSLAFTVAASGTSPFSTLSTPLARFSRALCVHAVDADLSRIAEPSPEDTVGDGRIVVTARSPNWTWLDLSFQIDDQAFEYDYEIEGRRVTVAEVTVPSGRHELHFNRRFGAAPIPFPVRRGATTTIDFWRRGLSELDVEVRIDGQIVYGRR